MHIGSFVRGKGKFVVTELSRPTKSPARRYPLLLTTGRILSQYNVGAQTRRTANFIWHEEDRLESIRTTPNSAASARAIG